MNKILSWGLLLVFASANLYADVFEVRVTNEEDDYGYTFTIALDDNGDIVKFLKIPDELEPIIFNVEDFEEGFVIDRRKLRDVVVMTSENFNPSYGGDVTLTYLYDGRPGFTEHRTFELKVDREGKQWTLTHEGKLLKGMHFKSKVVTFIGSVGVEEVEFTYAE